MEIYLSGSVSVTCLQIFWFVWMVSNRSILFCHQEGEIIFFSFLEKKVELAYIHSWI